MKVLVINCGSSSIKYQLFEMGKAHELLARGMADRIGLSGSYIYHRPTGRAEKKVERPFPDYETVLKVVFEVLTDSNSGVIKNLSEIEAVGHRIVHGGGKLAASVLVDAATIEAIRENAKFAPLHNPANIAGIEVCRQLLPAVPNVAVFDTAVHQTLPGKAFLYGLPRELYEKYGIRKYGFQGISHGYVANEAAKMINKPLKDLRIITCHLGNGSSITAFKNGRSVDTSMGLTPLEGVTMATRSGDVDPAIVLHLMEVLGLSVQEVKDLLNRRSGLLGLCGRSDMRDILEAASNGDEKAQAALEVFVYRIQKYIGAYVAALNGVDAIVFTAGIGENSPYLRQKVLSNFEYVGLKIDKVKNERNEAVFSSSDSNVFAFTIPTNEEVVIARETFKLVARRSM